jgi:hypothetical protein
MKSFKNCEGQPLFAPKLNSTFEIHLVYMGYAELRGPDSLADSTAHHRRPHGLADGMAYRIGPDRLATGC